MLPTFSRDFYIQNPFAVARQLLGARLYTSLNGELTGGRVVETEVYRGEMDRASHAYQNRRTPRTEVMFGPGGRAYIFRIYGRYTQFCVVTSPANVPDVVFIRALEPTDGIPVMQRRRGTDTLTQLTTGPGKLCIALGITPDLYGADLTGESIWLSPAPTDDAYRFQIIATTRIGIAYAGDDATLPWRFYMQGNRFVSRIS